MRLAASPRPAQPVSSLNQLRPYARMSVSFSNGETDHLTASSSPRDTHVSRAAGVPLGRGKVARAEPYRELMADSQQPRRDARLADQGPAPNGLKCRNHSLGL
jgi:hypothetical protein